MCWRSSDCQLCCINESSSLLSCFFRLCWGRACVNWKKGAPEEKSPSRGFSAQGAEFYASKRDRNPWPGVARATTPSKRDSPPKFAQRVRERASRRTSALPVRPPPAGTRLAKDGPTSHPPYAQVVQHDLQQETYREDAMSVMKKRPAMKDAGPAMLARFAGKEGCKYARPRRHGTSRSSSSSIPVVAQASEQAWREASTRRFSAVQDGTPNADCRLGLFISFAAGKLRYLQIQKLATAPKCGDCGVKLSGVRCHSPTSATQASACSLLNCVRSCRSPPSDRQSTPASRSDKRPSTVPTVVPDAQNAFVTGEQAGNTPRSRASRATNLTVSSTLVGHFRIVRAFLVEEAKIVKRVIKSQKEGKSKK